MPPPDTAGSADPNAAAFARLAEEFLDPDWYRARYPDVAASDLDPRQHFARYGAAERRDPNRSFDSAWYLEHHPDVAITGINPLLHYVQSGVADGRNPHPRFDAAWYIGQHPHAAANPLLYHHRVGTARGYPTEPPLDIRDYLPSQATAPMLPRGVFADVVIPLRRGTSDAAGCIRSVLADRDFPLARIIVVVDLAVAPQLRAWLEELAGDGQIHLIRSFRRLGFAAAVDRGIDAAADHDVVVLASDTTVEPGWLRHLTAQAYAEPAIATVSPLCDRGAITGRGEDAAAGGEAQAQIDALCRKVNAGRSAAAEAASAHCVYIRRAALRAVGSLCGEGFAADETALRDFCARATAAGLHHRTACDLFVERTGHLPPDRNTMPADIVPFQFAVTAALFRASPRPVILMISHDFGGGVRRHIDFLVERCGDKAHVLLLEGSARGAVLSLPGSHPVLALPAARLDDLLTVLRSVNLARIHIHHLLHVDMDVRILVQRLGVPFDLTVHDYFAICPQVNLLRWEEGVYCGEPAQASCNACIAGQSSHSARDIVSWRRSRAWQFIDAERVICPSNDVKTRLDRHRIGARAIVVPHEEQEQPVWTTNLPQFSGNKLRIVLLGTLANHKGARAVAEVAEQTDKATIELHLAGYLEATFPQPAARRIKVTGQYRERDLPAILERIDPHVFWLPSSAPETYSFTLSTAIASGRPIVATDLGSFRERLAGRPLTWLVDHRAPARDWLAAFDAVRTTLRAQAPPPRAPRELARADFYPDRYLAPPGRRSAAPARRTKIVVVPERYHNGGPTPCASIRLLQPLDHLAGGLDVDVADAESVFGCHADIIVTQRHAIADVTTADRLAEYARRSGAKLLFDLDDDLLDVPRTHPDAAVLRPLAKSVRRMLALADAVWVSTAELAARLAPVRADAIVIENRLDERIWVEPQPPAVQWDDPVRILCMGTTTHERDFALIEKVLLRLKSEYADRVAIDVLGMTRRSELPPGLTRIGPPPSAARSYPGFVNWLTAAAPNWHIGLAPLLDTRFNRAKSPLKAMDYAAMGLAVLASDVAVYRGSIADGSAGQLVANHPAAWHAALDWLIRDQALRKSTAARARQAFLAQASLASHADARRAALARLLPERSLVA